MKQDSRMYVAEAMTLPSPMRPSGPMPDPAGSSLISPSTFDAALMAATAPLTLATAQPANLTPEPGELDALALLEAWMQPDALTFVPVPAVEYALPVVQPPDRGPAPSEEPAETSDPSATAVGADQVGCPLADVSNVVPAQAPALPPVLPASLAVAPQAGNPRQRADRTGDLAAVQPMELPPLPEMATLSKVIMPTSAGAGVPVPNPSIAAQTPSLPSNPRIAPRTPLPVGPATGPIPPQAFEASIARNVSISLPLSQGSELPPTSPFAAAISRIPPANPKDAPPDTWSHSLPVSKEVGELPGSILSLTTGQTETVSARSQTPISTTAPSPHQSPVQGVQSPFSTEHPEWHAGLVERVVHQLTATSQSMDLTLAPENLGRVHIRLELQDGTAQVFFTTETNEAAKLLSANESQLADLFSRAGLTLAGQDTMREGASRGAPLHQPTTARQRQPQQNSQTLSNDPHKSIINLVA